MTDQQLSNEVKGLLRNQLPTNFQASSFRVLVSYQKLLQDQCFSVFNVWTYVMHHQVSVNILGGQDLIEIFSTILVSMNILGGKELIQVFSTVFCSTTQYTFLINSLQFFSSHSQILEF